jgi:hypothetical protein
LRALAAIGILRRPQASPFGGRLSRRSGARGFPPLAIPVIEPARPIRRFDPAGTIAVLLSMAFALACGGGGDGGPTGTPSPAGLRFVDRTPIADTIGARDRTMVVELRDEGGRAISGAPVAISSWMKGSAFFSAAFFFRLPVGWPERALTVTTDGSGRAQFGMWLGSQEGTGFVVADAGDGRRDSVAVTTLPGRPVALSITPLDTSVLVLFDVQSGMRLTVPTLGSYVATAWRP